MRHKFLLNIVIPTLLIILVFPTISSLFRSGYYPMHDDMQAMRLLQIDKCVKDGQIPCRWVPDMGFGYGYPQYNYYSPLPYYLMEGFHLAGFGFLDSVKLFFVLATIISVLGMYVLGSNLWGKWGGLMSAILYAYVPYRALNLYARGATGEIATMAIIPFIFLFVIRLIEGKKYSVLGLALSLAALLTSHNISSLIFIPLAFLWFLFLMFQDKINITPLFINKTKKLILSYILGFSLSAFFVIPALLEVGYVQVDTMISGYFNYLAHFVGLPQMLLSNYWGYGASIYGPNDQLMLGVGLVYWLLPLLVLFLLFFLKKTKTAKVVMFLVVVGWLGLFMMHSKSTFIWQNINFLVYFQFPWRFLILSTFVFSLAAGAMVKLFEASRRDKFLSIIAITVIAIGFSGNFFRPTEWLDMTDEDKFTGDSWQSQQTISIKDYLPVFVKTLPKQAALDTPVVISGEVSLILGEKGTNWQRWEYIVAGDAALIELQQYFFPGWIVKVNGQEEEIFYDNDQGLMRVNLPRGKAVVDARLTDTPIRSISNLLSLVGVLGLFTLAVREKKK